MPQNGTIDLTSGFVPNTSAPPPPIDLSAGFQETAPARPAAPVRATRPEQIPGLTPTTKKGQGPAPGTLIPQEMDTFGSGDAGVYVNPDGTPQQSPSDLLSDLAKQMKARAMEHENEILSRAAKGGPPESLAERMAINRLHNGAMVANLGSGATSLGGATAIGATAALGPLAGIPIAAYYAAKDLLTPRAKEESQPDALQRHLLAVSGLVGAASAVPEAGEQIGSGVRSTVRRMVGAGPGEVSEAGAAAGEQAASVAQKNSAATAKAELANQTDISKAQGNYNEALAEREGAGNEAQQKYQQARAQWEQDNTAGAQRVEEQRKAETAKQVQRKQLLDEANSHATTLGQRLDDFMRKTETEVKESYPEIRGEADPADISERMKAAAETAMKEHGPVPGPIQRIISRYTPPESETGLEETPGTINLGDASSEMLDQMMEQGIFLPDEQAALSGEGAAAKPNFANLHSQYSAMGKLAAAAKDGYQRAAYLGAQDVLRQAMRGLSDAEGPETTAAFQASQGRFRQMARTFYNRSSPIAKAIAKYREVTGALQDDPNAAATAAPFLRQILSEAKAHGYAKQLLSQFPGAPVDELDAMKGALDQANQLPPKAKVIPNYVPKPEPQPGEPGPPPVHEQPVPAHVANLEPPPEPFNSSQFIKGKLTEKARQMQHLSPFEVGAPAAAAIGLMRYGPEAALAPLAYPVARYGIGRLLENPTFQDWVAKEPGGSFGQPGTPGARGNPTPFGAPPPSSPEGPSTPLGAGPSTPFTEKRGNDTGPPAGVPERRISSITSAKNAGVADRLQKFGITHQPLDADMGVEWQMILEDMRAAGKTSMTRAQRGLAQDAMNSWNRGTFTAEETANRIRSALGLGSGAK